jgi:outer membrane protein insertion porin family
MGQLVYSQQNFDITDWPKSFKDFMSGNAFKGAGQSLRIAAEPGTEVSQYSVTFTDPYFRDKPVSLDVAGSSWSRFRESYAEERLKGFVGFEKRLKDKWRKSIGIRCEDVDVSSLDSDAPQEIIDVKGKNALYGVMFGIGRDLRDDKWSPSSGRWFNASYEQVTGDKTFGVLSGTYRWYKTLFEDLAERKTVLATKLLGAYILGDAQPFEKFYAGGTGTYGIRGFDYRGVSHRGLQTNVVNPQRQDPIGSDWIFLANTEVTVPIASDNFAALFFLDSGAVDTGGYRASVGIGVQILMQQWFGPVPMRFELATPFMKDGDDETQTFSFSVGRLF